jgi:hypothetical protein
MTVTIAILLILVGMISATLFVQSNPLLARYQAKHRALETVYTIVAASSITAGILLITLDYWLPACE